MREKKIKIFIFNSRDSREKIFRVGEIIFAMSDAFGTLVSDRDLFFLGVDASRTKSWKKTKKVGKNYLPVSSRDDFSKIPNAQIINPIEGRRH